MKIQCLLSEQDVENLFSSLLERELNLNTSYKSMVLANLMKTEKKKLTPREVYSDWYLLSLEEDEHEKLVVSVSTKVLTSERITEMTLMVRRNLHRGELERDD